MTLRYAPCLGQPCPAAASACDGPATLRELRGLDPCLRCCFLTGEPGGYGEEGLLALGAERVFLKPFRLPELAAALRTLLNPA
jgi:DNA-binding response OmpR family regulator